MWARRILFGVPAMLPLFFAHVWLNPDGAVAQSSATPTTAPTPNPVAHAISWRLPINGSAYISNGPGEGLHINTSAESIDYAPSPAQSIQVVAPADGTVIDYLTGNNGGFGHTLRIYHPSTNSCSFFAHLDSALVSAGQAITQGQSVAWTGNTGNGAGFHLHFEARSGCVAGNVFSGSPIALRPLMGNWWNEWYAPPEPVATLTHNPQQFSGGAQYPENSSPPSLVAGNNPRHLAGSAAPNGFPVAYASNISNVQVTLHMGASPDAPTLSTDANFQALEYRDQRNWFILSNANPTNNPTYVRALQAFSQCLPTGQYCYAVLTKLVSSPTWNQQSRYVDVLAKSNSPYLMAAYNRGEQTVFLEFKAPDIPPYQTTYYLYEWHGGEVFVRSLGATSQITVNRITNAINAYNIAVDYGPGQFDDASTGWVYLHDDNANLFPSRVYLPLIRRD
jgi:hypothetical protein